ncbi:hypothetical protein M0R45_022824 [Rubus argutus]|uniref:Uncharacterized protein n=1 Tax=Rubus argutus TaxID=59490 RepID=A0AAW1XFS8_RUBAR
MVSRVFMPLFVTNCVVMANVRELGLDASLPILLATMLTKFVATRSHALYCKIPTTDAFALAFIISYKGVVEVGGYFMTSDGKKLTDRLYAMGLLFTLFTQITITFSVKRLYKPSSKYLGYQQRNVASLRPNSELKILSCIHRHDNVPAFINLLDTACPTGDSPILLHVLHLIEMTG